MILGGGPNRIGQGIEFDYCCVHAAFALKEEGFETMMVNSNPGNRFHRLRHERQAVFRAADVGGRAEHLRARKCWGVIAQFGGQTPLNLAAGLQKNGVNIIGTSPASIELAEDRKLFAAMLDKLEPPQPPNGTAVNEDEAAAVAAAIGYPVLVRPSFVLGGRAMEIVYEDADLRRYMRNADRGQPRAARSWWTASSKTPPRWTWIACSRRRDHRARRASWNTSNRPAFTRATAPA